MGKAIFRENGEKTSLFKRKHRKLTLLLAAFLVALLVTGGLFAYTSLIASASIGVTVGTSDFASVVVDANPPASYTLLGRQVGSIGSGTLFDISRTAGYTGDLEVQLYLTNVDELVQDYSYWMVRVEVQDLAGTKKDVENATLILSLQNPVASFAVQDWSATRYVRITGGSYRALPFAIGLAGNDPLILCQVAQVGQ